MPLISDPGLDAHLRGAEWYINNALRPGTQANHLSALKAFITFNYKYGLDYRQVSVSSICTFIHQLTLSHDNPTTILNYASNLCAVLKRLALDVTPFRSINVADFLSSIKVNVRHTPNRRQPVSHQMLHLIVWAAYEDKEGPTVAFAFILLFFTMFRQSNTAQRTVKQFDATRQLLRSDILTNEESLIVTLKWSKTRQVSMASSVAAPALPGADICPVGAYKQMLEHAPTVSPSQALLCFPDCRPMPISYLNKVWDTCLLRLGAKRRDYTLHSLRRGAATEVFSDSPASLDQIKRHGDWASSAVFSYLPHDPRNSEVYRHFQTLA